MFYRPRATAVGRAKNLRSSRLSAPLRYRVRTIDDERMESSQSQPARPSWPALRAPHGGLSFGRQGGMRMGRRQAGDPLRWPEIVPRGDPGASGYPTAARQGATAATDASAAAGQSSVAKRLSTDAGTKGDSAMKKRAVEMAEWWKAWKSKSRISPLPTAPWKSRKSREIPTFPQLRRRDGGKVENQKQVSHFPTAFSWVEGKTKSSRLRRRRKRGHFYRGKNGDISNEA